MSNISDIELNQLRLLQIIFETRNLTRAGERAGLTQSAVSHTLKKLRHSLNDSLVIRQGNQLVLTPRAERLQVALNRWLHDFERNILNQEAFDPESTQRTFYIATSDLVEQSIAPPLIALLQREAPRIQVIFIKIDKLGIANQIESGESDLSISTVESNHPSLMVKTLYRDDFTSVVRTDHPFLKSKKDVHNFCNYPHILAGTGRDNRGMVDEALEKIGLSRNVQFKVANFSSAPYIVERSDAILTAPRKFIQSITSKFNIKLFTPPISLPHYSMKVYWNLRNKDDQANKWLRDKIAEAAHIENVL
ncbi:LysR family transcriptional regulator [Microbulbifer sp. CnH-101-G]|uniref:LysR family transcriptional regulator n=1 Tax=Microbulbifer sp. CnH-101-G TaxID=3243393 RepID=UPI00403A4F54